MASSEPDKYELQAQIDEKQQAEANAATAKLFDPAEMFGKTKQIHTITDEKLGVIKYGKLSQKEFDLAGKEPDINKRIAKRIFLMLQKGYPEMTEESFEDWPAEVVMRITDALAREQSSFLFRTTANLNSGSSATPKR